MLERRHYNYITFIAWTKDHTDSILYYSLVFGQQEYDCAWSCLFVKVEPTIDLSRILIDILDCG